MSGGTRSHHGRNPPEEDLMPSPTVARVLQDIDTNRLRNEHLLQRVAQNTKPRFEGVTLGNFIKAQPPVFAESQEPIDADDWLRTIERKFFALHVHDSDRVNFATYQLEGAAGVW